MNRSELLEKVAHVWDDEYTYPGQIMDPMRLKKLSHFTVEVEPGTIRVCQMYEYLPLTFKHLKALAEIFGTEDFNVNQWSSSGCETCDWGSRYEHTFSNLPKELFQ